MAVTTHLITGGAGNLACQLTFELAARGAHTVLVDIAERPTAAVAPGTTYIRGDMANADDVAAMVAQYRPQTILHFASLLSGSCEQNRELAWRVNMDGMFALLEAALKNGVRTVLFPSSLASYGRVPSPLPEDHPQWPASLYGVTKVAGERLGVYYHQKHGLDFRCVRLPIVISRFAPPGASSAYASHAFVHGYRDGSFIFKVRPQTRASAVYVQDVLKGMIALLDAPPEKLSRRVYNIHGISPSAQEIADAIIRRRSGIKFAFEPDPSVVNLIESWPAQIEDASARVDWGWKPQYDLDRLADDMLADLADEGNRR